MGMALAAALAGAAELLVGGAETSITPEQSVSLDGQFHTRLSQGIESPCMVNVIAIEARESGKAVDQAILVSVDVVSIKTQVQNDFRAYMAGRAPGLDTDKLFLAAIHTHTAPTLMQATYSDYGDALQPKDYLPFLYERVSEAVVKAWESRKPAKVAWGLGHAVVAQNRRAAYANGSSAMYGKVDRKDFLGLEGWEDHALDVLCFTDMRDQLLAVSLAVPCPAQVVEGLWKISSDYMGDLRENLRAKYGRDLIVAGFIAPAGDMVPRPMLRKVAESRMEKLRGLSRKQELGRRIANAFDDVWGVIRKDLRADVVFSHRVERFGVPMRKVTDGERKSAQATCDDLTRKIEDANTKDADRARAIKSEKWHRNVIDRYEAQQAGEQIYDMEMHVLRIGDLAVATNPFELFQDFGMRIQGRSQARQTMLIQLASPADAKTPAGYLPSERAVKGGGYSAIVQSSRVGPEGGQALVERTLEVIGEMFKK